MYALNGQKELERVGGPITFLFHLINWGKTPDLIVTMISATDNIHLNGRAVKSFPEPEQNLQAKL